MNLRPLPFGSALTHSHCSLINMHITSDKSREVILRGGKSWEPKYSNPVNNTSEIKEVINWKQKNIQRVSHLGEPARSGNTGGPPYDVMVHGLLRNLEFSLFWMYILLQTLEMWLASHSCKHPLYLRVALAWFFFLLLPLQILQNLISSPRSLRTSSTVWTLNHFPFEEPKTPYFLILSLHWKRTLGLEEGIIWQRSHAS